MVRSIHAAALAVALLLSGCASMMNKGKQSIVINSSPQGAAVYENGAEVGQTPYTYTYDRSDGQTATLELRKEGHEGRTVELRPRTSSGPLLVDALLLNIPYYVADSKSNMLYTFPQKELVVNLYKELPKTGQRTDLPVVTLRNVSGKAPSSSRSSHAPVNLRVLNDLEYPDQVTSSLLSGMRNTFVEARTVRSGTEKGDEAIKRAKVYLQPIIRHLEPQLSEIEHRAFGQVDMDVDWEFHSGIVRDSVLFTISKHTSYTAYAEAPTEVLGNAMKDAGRRMLEEDGLEERLRKVYDSGLVLSKGQALDLPRPHAIPFSGRKDMLAALVKAVVTVETDPGHGSGFLITNDGYIITNAHVVGNASTVKIRFEQGFTLDGVVVKVNKDFDVALIKTPGNDLPALTIGDDAGLQLGEELFAIGTPLDEKLGQTVTRGVLSGHRVLEGRSYIQTDVSINPGNSGGPLIDESGRVVGVATLKISETGVQGIGFGVPISKALEMLNISFR